MTPTQPAELISATQAPARNLAIPSVPASAFGIVLGLSGLSNSWRAAAELWHLPPGIAIGLAAISTLTWFALMVLYIAKWLLLRDEAMQELSHPIQCCFVGLLGVSTMLVGGGMAQFSVELALVFFWAGAAFTIAFALWRIGGLWQGGRDPATTTAVLYLPAVAGSFVTAIVGSGLIGQGLGRLAFGAGFFSWLAIESVLLNRLLTASELPEALRPTIGIQLAPPAVGTVAYLSATSGAPDMLAMAMFGYAVFQSLLMLRVLPWVARQGFTASYWAFTFGATALATAGIRMVGRGVGEPVNYLAPPIFVAVNIAVGLIAMRTLVLLLRGKLFPVRR